MRVSQSVFPVLVMVLLCAVPSHAFRDDFDTLDSSRWTVYQNAGTASVQNGKLVLSAQYASTFPYIHSTGDPFPLSGDFSMRFRIRFSSIAVRGTGIQAGIGVPRNTLENPGNVGPDNQFEYWGDTSCPRDTAFHDVEFLFQSGLLKEFNDGGLVQQLTCRRPDVIWMGNPSWPFAAGEWSCFELDYIEVTPVPEPSGLFAFALGVGTLARAAWRIRR